MVDKNKNTQTVNEDEEKDQTDKKVVDQSENKSEETKEAAENSESEEAEEKIEDKKEAKDNSKKKSGKKKKESKEEALEKELEDSRYKLSEINDRYMRLSAEFDNYRKRTLKEKADMLKTAGGDVLADVLPVVDDFERALQSMEKATDIDAVKQGVDLIYTKFKEFIKSKGIAEIEALHQDFDTDLHEALTKIPAPSEDLKGKVVDVIQKGYKIEDKIIRYAKVVIGE